MREKRSADQTAHVVSVLEIAALKSASDQQQDVHLLSRAGRDFWVTVEGILDVAVLLGVAILTIEDQQPVQIEFHCKELRGKPGLMIRKIIRTWQ